MLVCQYCFGRTMAPWSCQNCLSRNVAPWLCQNCLCMFFQILVWVFHMTCLEYNVQKQLFFWESHFIVWEPMLRDVWLEQTYKQTFRKNLPNFNEGWEWPPQSYNIIESDPIILTIWPNKCMVWSIIGTNLGITKLLVMFKGPRIWRWVPFLIFMNQIMDSTSIGLKVNVH